MMVPTRVVRSLDILRQLRRAQLHWQTNWSGAIAKSRELWRKGADCDSTGLRWGKAIERHLEGSVEWKRQSKLETMSSAMANRHM